MRRVCGESADTGTHYVQLSLATRAGGGRPALGACGTTRLPMRTAGPPSLLAQLQAAVTSPPLAPLASQLGPWQSSMLYVGPVGTLAPCHWDALDNIYTQLHGTKQVCSSDLNSLPVCEVALHVGLTIP